MVLYFFLELLVFASNLFFFLFALISLKRCVSDL